MTDIAVIKCIPEKNLECSKTILKNLENHKWVYLSPPKDQQTISTSSTFPKGEGIIISSGGSIGGPNLCLQPIKNLTNSALSTGKWLKNYGLKPNECIILNSLPLHHISGFMPWWRHHTWRADYHWISHSLMHKPSQLNQFTEALANKYRRPLITSLVPTQLLSLINDPDGLKWLQSFAVIWVGGALIPKDLADKARRKSINLAPCYGATETVAMVTCLSPKDFLKGSNSVGFPLEDVEIKINKRNELHIKTTRIATSIWKNDKLESIDNFNGWWKAGDLGKYITLNKRKAIQILGRRDSAINSGLNVDNFASNGVEYCYEVEAVYAGDASDLAGPTCATPEAQTIYEIFHDDGTDETSINAGGLLLPLAVKFTPEAYPVDLYRASFYCPGTSNGDAFITVWDDDGENGMPGTVLVENYPATLLGGQWTPISLSSFDVTINEGSFYVGRLELNNTPPIGVDSDNSPENSFIDIGYDFGLEPFSNYFDGALMIRAEVDSANVLGLHENPNSSIPIEFSLRQNYPNPFNPTTTISFSIPSYEFISVKVYDLNGKLITSLIEKNLGPGEHSVIWDAKNSSSGQYLVKMDAMNFSKTEVVTLVK